MIRQVNKIEQRLTTAHHLWRNGPIKRMNRTITETTVSGFPTRDEAFCDPTFTTYDKLHLPRRRNTLFGLTPFEYTCEIRTSEPDRFIPNPNRQTLAVNASGYSA